MTKIFSRESLCKNRSGVGATSLLTAIGYILGVMILLFIILPMGGRFLGLTLGGTAEAATSIDRGFADLISKAEKLAAGESVPHVFTVDKGFYLVSFNKGETNNGKAISPPECLGASCLCVCVDDKCEKIEPEKNRGRDCRTFFQYNAIIAQMDINGNSGGKHPSYIYDDGTTKTDGYFFYVKGEKTVSVKLTNKNKNLYIGKG